MSTCRSEPENRRSETRPLRHRDFARGRRILRIESAASRQRLGLRRPSGALARAPEAAEACRTPKPCGVPPPPSRISARPVDERFIARGTPRRRRSRGFLLIDCLIYIGVLAVVLLLAFSAFYKCLDFSRDLNRNAADIARALQAGEHWRADIRLATAAPKLVSEEGWSALEIPQSTGTIVYLFADGTVWRKPDLQAPARKVLSDVQTSRMDRQPRTQVVAWSWTVELRTKKRFIRVRPTFDFLAVARPAGPL